MHQPSLPPWEKALSQAMLYFLITPGIEEIGEMVGLNSEELERALCSRTMETAKEKVVTALSVIQVGVLRGWGGGLISSLFCGCHSNRLALPCRLSMLGMLWLRTSIAAFSTG